MWGQVDLTYLGPHGEGAVFRIHQKAAESGLNTELGVRLTWIQMLALPFISLELVTLPLGPQFPHV